MNISTKLLKAAAGQAAGGASLDVDEVFSTFLYDGTGSAQTITNNIDLSGEGGLVWIKTRTNDVYSGYDNLFFDTERTLGKKLIANSTNAEASLSNGFTAFNSNGFSIGSSVELNSNGEDIVSWTFRKAPKFFDIVTYTGDNTSNRAISHNLGSTPGMIICKSTSSGQWGVWHRSLSGNNGLRLDSTAAAGGSLLHDSSTVNSTSFEVSTGGYVLDNQNQDYVAYLFAHNNNDGGFGPDGDADIIKCGTCSGESGSNRTINLGFEPQWIMTKSVGSGDWRIMDTMRGLLASGTSVSLEANDSGAEGSDDTLHITPTGFYVNGLPGSGDYIYMAIRRGPLAAPEDATKVFSIDTLGTSAPYFDSNHIVDMGLVKQTGAASSWFVYTRLVGEKNFYTDFTAAENNASEAGFDFMNGHIDSNWGGTNSYSWMWKRAPGYFDVVAYTGAGAAQTVNHNLGVVPEMMWIKNRGATENWVVYHSGIDSSTPEDYYLRLNQTSARIDIDGGAGNRFNQTAPTASVFTVGTDGDVNGSSVAYIAYLFATVAGISKVGSYTGNGSSQTIDCGFSSGARFVLIKSSTQATEWNVFDTARGIVSGNDPALFLDNTSAEVTNGDFIDPHSSGFTINYVTSLQGCNTNGETYIFYAIA